MVDTLAIISVSAAILFWILFCYRGDSWAKSLIKTIPLTGLALIAVMEDAPLWLSFALLLSAAGDFALSRPGKAAFVAGLIAFALAHVAYIGLFMFGLMSTTTAVPYWVFGVLLGTWIIVLTVVLPHTGALRGAVVVYLVVITGMVLAAGQFTHRDFFFLQSALLFAASDLILSVQLFRKLPARWDIMASLLIWPLYYVGQFGILVNVVVEKA